MPESNSIPSPLLNFGGVEVGIFTGEHGDQGGIVEQWTDRGLEIAIEFVVPWVDRIKFLQALRGSCSATGDSVVRVLPASLPDNTSDLMPTISGRDGAYPWNRYFCMGTGDFRPIKWRTDQDGESIAGKTGWGYYDWAIIPTRWAVPPYIVGDKQLDPTGQGYDISGMPYTTVKFKSSGEVFSPGINTYKFAGSSDPINEASVGIIRPKIEAAITRHFMPSITVDAYTQLIGKVNSDESMRFGDLTFSQESILYINYEWEMYGDPATGTNVFDITHNVMINGPVVDKDGSPQTSWNYFLNRQGVWDVIVSKEGGHPVYESTSFVNVIWPEGYETA